MAKPPGWLTRAFSLIERDDLTVNLDQLTTLQKVLLSALCHILLKEAQSLSVGRERFGL